MIDASTSSFSNGSVPSTAPPWRMATRVPRNIPRILVAEDDAEMRRLVVEALSKDGYVVEEVADGARLFEHVMRQIIYASLDLVVSDIRMPGYNGVEIVDALRSVDFRIPVILMTAFGDDATRRRAESIGAVLFDKPFELDDLRTAVLNLVGSARRQ